MFHLIWKDYDDYYVEKFTGHIDFAKRILEIYRKEDAEEYGTTIIAVIDGTEVNCEYKVDLENNKEEIYLYGDIVLTHDMPDPTKIIKIKCPFCKGKTKKGAPVSTFICGVYSTVDSYKCDAGKCGKEFYI